MVLLISNHCRSLPLSSILFLPQAHTGDPKLAKAMFLPLAEKMADKYSKSGKIEAEAEVQMILIILELQGKYQEALDVIQGPLAGRITV